MKNYLKALFVLIFMSLWTLQFNDYFEMTYVSNIIGLVAVCIVILFIPSSSFIINEISVVVVSLLSDFFVNTNSLFILPVGILLADFKYIKTSKTPDEKVVKQFDIINIVLVILYAARLIIFRANQLVTPIYDIKTEHIVKIMCLILPLFVFSLKPFHKKRSTEIKAYNHMFFFSIVMFIIFNTTVVSDFTFISWTLYACVLLIFGNPVLDFCIEKVRCRLCI